MVLARWQSTIVDEEGNVIAAPNIEVRREGAGTPLAALYSDRSGSTPMANPFVGDDSEGEGFVFFHVEGGAFRIRAYKGSFERIYRYVAIGTNAEADTGSAFIPRGQWLSSETYDLNDLVSHRVGAEPYAFVSNTDANNNHEPPFDTGGVGTSDDFWTVMGLIESPGTPGSSDVVGTSITSIAIGTGTKTFTIVEDDRGWGVGARLRVSSDAGPMTDYMEGVVTDYAGNTLELEVDTIVGSGSHADWTINIAGDPGTFSGSTDLTVYTTSGTANAIVITPAGPTFSLHLFKASVANTGAATMNGDPLLDKDGNALVADFIQPDIWYLLLNDGTDYKVIMSGAVI